jgi:hypothetical protein
MAPPPPSLAAIFAGLRTALEADRRAASFVDGVVLAVLLMLLGRLERMACTWHAAQRHGDEPLPEELLPYAEGDRTLRVRLPTDGTHIALRTRRLYIFGPGPGRGLRPHPRRTPLARPRIAHAPPGPAAAQRHRHPGRQIEAVQHGHPVSP